MNPDTDRNYIRVHRGVLLAVVLILAAGILGWWLGRSNNKQEASTSSSATISEANRSETSAGEVDELISYRLPDGWKKSSCEGSESTYIAPANDAVDCNSDPAAPLRLSVDSGNTKDCNQLQNVSDVKKHVCISLYINGLRSLKASTEYLASSAYKQETTIDAYYIDTGKGVIKAQYRHGLSSELRAGFDELVNSINSK